VMFRQNSADQHAEHGAAEQNCQDDQSD